MQRVLITGGSRGLGASLVQQFQSADYLVDAPTRDQLDLRSPMAIKSLLSGRCYDLLVCNAGFAHDALMAKLDAHNWHDHWQVNCNAALQCAQALIPAMKAQQSGHIILISSYSALHPPIGQVAYASAKAALLGLTQDLAQSLGRDHIRVNCILPGFLQTQMTAHLPPHRIAQVQHDHCLPEFNTCQRVAQFIQFLHEQLPFTSGQSFQLDSRIP